MILVPTLGDIERNATSDAERTVARLLQRVASPPDSVAFHSVRLRNHAVKQQAEADFVILHKGVLIVAEVKGGGVVHEEGVWHSVDRRGVKHRLRTSPMEQAQSASFALRVILREEGLAWFALEAVVITPDIAKVPTGIGWKATHWLTSEEMSVAGIASALDTIAAGAPEAPPRQRRARVDDLRDRLYGHFARLPAIDARRGAVIEEQNKATADQARFLSQADRNERLLLTGGAGTGKSLVLVEAAKLEAAKGRSVLVTFKSASLGPFFTSYLRDHRVDVVPFDELRRVSPYDVVFVDEAQDLMSAKAMDTLDGVISGGRAAGRWRMFLDPNNQAHVDGDYDGDVAALVADEAMTLDLATNVRNTRSIVEVVQKYLGADVGDPGIVHGDRVNWVTADTSSAEEGIRIAQALRQDGVKAGDIWIVVVSSMAAPMLVDDVMVTSPRSAKGLEAEHVIVCALPEVWDDPAVNAFYVAITRARVSLHIVSTRADRRNLLKVIDLRTATT